MEYTLDKMDIYSFTPDKMKSFCEKHPNSLIAFYGKELTFMLPSFYEGSLQMERVDWSKLIEFEVSKLDKYITYMEWNVTK